MAFSAFTLKTTFIFWEIYILFSAPFPMQCLCSTCIQDLSHWKILQPNLSGAGIFPCHPLQDSAWRGWAFRAIWIYRIYIYFFSGYTEFHGILNIEIAPTDPSRTPEYFCEQFFIRDKINSSGSSKSWEGTEGFGEVKISGKWAMSKYQIKSCYPGKTPLFSQSFASSPTPQAPASLTRLLPKRETEEIVAGQGRTWLHVKAGSTFQNSSGKNVIITSNCILIPLHSSGDQVFRDSSFSSATSWLFQQGNSQLLPLKCFFHGIPMGRFLHFHGFLFSWGNRDF